jgi:hypothetical protein
VTSKKCLRKTNLINENGLRKTITIGANIAVILKNSVITKKIKTPKRIARNPSIFIMFFSIIAISSRINNTTVQKFPPPVATHRF